MFCQMKSPLNIEQALYARDALGKGIYDRLFTWIVKKINSSLAKRVGVLNISVSDRGWKVDVVLQ